MITLRNVKKSLYFILNDLSVSTLSSFQSICNHSQIIPFLLSLQFPRRQMLLCWVRASSRSEGISEGFLHRVMRETPVSPWGDTSTAQWDYEHWEGMRIAADGCVSSMAFDSHISLSETVTHQPLFSTCYKYLQKVQGQNILQILKKNNKLSEHPKQIGHINRGNPTFLALLKWNFPFEPLVHKKQATF